MPKLFWEIPENAASYIEIPATPIQILHDAMVLKIYLENDHVPDDYSF